jgi:glycosyltransferase involved in cell wall biosynthesis
MESGINNNIPILTIAIPTWNRASFLNRCLTSICTQNHDLLLKIEIIVSDNGSTDETEQIVNNYKVNGHTINYIKNKENYGVEYNIAQCYTSGSGKYVLVFGDDDFFMENSFDIFIPLLQLEKYELVNISNTASKSNIIEEISDGDFFLKKISFWCTFISGNIIKRDYVNKVLLETFKGTYLGYVPSILNSITSNGVKCIINREIVKAQPDNSGGYKLFQVFGTNFKEILSNYINRGLSNHTFNQIMNDMLLIFFPQFLYITRFDKNNRFNDNKVWPILFKEYRGYLLFWILLAPLFFLPKLFSKIWIRIVINPFTLIRKRIIESKAR